MEENEVHKTAKICITLHKTRNKTQKKNINFFKHTRYIDILNIEQYKQAGITLVALVVTIIVLLILAGVTISLALGSNGMIEKTKIASETWKNSTKIEELIVDEIDDNIEKIEKDYVIEKIDLKVGEESLKSISQDDIMNLYGKETNYKSIIHPDIKWQLFYDDNINYYVIASDYVPNSELPCEGVTIGRKKFASTDLLKSTNTTSLKANYCARFSTNNYNDYVLTSTTEYRRGSQANTLKEGESNRNLLVSTYLKWVDEFPNSTNKNIMAVAYMMDIGKWGSFADGSKGAYAMGGPTLEMFSLSYNARHSTNKLGVYETVDLTNTNENGYKVKIGENEWSNSISGVDKTNAIGENAGNMWVRTSSTKADGMWLASPSSIRDYGLIYISRDGVLGFSYDYAYFNTLRI
ncbi:MAG: hypothetical protein IKG14_04460 [Clostridia bacterium]|nr:hypothetical protein [Clostridia bacterium]